MPGRTFLFAGAVATALMLISCDAGSFVEPTSPDGDSPGLAASLTIDSTPSLVTEDDSLAFSVTVEDIDGEPIPDAQIDWASTDVSIVFVEPTGPSDGTLIAMRPGTATITASYASLSVSLTIEVHNRPVDLVYVAGSGQSGDPGTELPDSLAVRVIDKRGDPVSDVQLSFAVTAGGGQVAMEGDRTDTDGRAAASWTLGAAGQQIAEARVSAAQARVRHVKDSVVTFTASLVGSPTDVATVTITPDSVTLEPDETRALQADVKDGNGNSLNTPAVTWSSTDPGVATVSARGLITGRAVGSVRVTAAAGGVVDSADVQVVTTPPPTVTVEPATDTVQVAASVQLVATVVGSDGAEIADPTVFWASSDTAIAVVSGGGVVTGVREGDIRITATAEGGSGTAAITVAASAGGTLTISPADTLYGIGDTLSLTVEARAADGSVIPDPEVRWTSQNPGIATVDSMGRITARAIGIAIIAVSSVCCAGDFTEAVVSDLFATGVDVRPASITISEGGSRQFTAVAIMNDGSEQTAAVSWSATGGTISSSGLYTAGNTVGSHEVVATHSDGYADTAAVTVQDAGSFDAGAAFIIGPQAAVGGSPWDFFDTNEVQKAAEHYQTATSTSGNEYVLANYYDLALGLYTLHRRTGDTTYRNMARNVADKWATYMASRGWGYDAAAPRHSGFGGLILRALDGRPDLWPGILKHAREQYDVWLGLRLDYPNLHYGIRDGGFTLLAVAQLAEVHPDPNVRSEMRANALAAATRYYARLQAADGGWYWKDSDGAVCGGCFFAQPFMVGMLLEGLVATHQVTGDATVRSSIIAAVDWLWNKGYQRTEPSNMVGSGVLWRAMRYFVFEDGTSSDYGSADAYNQQDGLIRDKRQLNATTVHAFGYAYQLTGDPRYQQQGDDVFAATFGKGQGPGADAYWGLADFRAKEYNQSYRSAGRYLVWR